MDPLTISAAGGMRSRMESLDLLANNLANADTGGYKTDREFFGLFIAPDAAAPDASGLNAVPVIERNWIDFAQGALRNTSNQLDFAIDGKGFFAVDSPSGVAYTRNGAFRLSPAGALVTAEGYTVRNATGSTFKLDPATPIEVLADGTVMQSGQAAGKLALVDFENPQLLSKQGANYFRTSNDKVAAQASTAQIHQGKLEGSNVGSAEAAVRLVNVMRQFEMLQRALSIGGEMNKKAVEDVARVGS
jgi:flagellar basal-body rod protein FlgF